jgi:cytochrome c556
MTFFMKPAYVELQRASGKPPVDRAEWSALYVKAVRLAETANLLFIRRHADADTPAWAERSAAARQAAADVASAVERGLRNARPDDFDVVKEKFGVVSAACNACHRQFGGTNAPAIRP